MSSTGEMSPAGSPGLFYPDISSAQGVMDLSGARAVCIKRSEGTYYLAIWDEQTAPQYTDRVTVTLSRAATVTEYDPTRGTTPIATFTNVTSVPLTLSDHVVFLVIP